ncbi:MAG: helix-hairpin-helix domain-containing protein [Candidatus Heimdallarchaeota archaeon]
MVESEILKIPGIGKKAAKTLEDCGFNTIEKITKSNAEELSQLPGIGKVTAEKIIDGAKEIQKAAVPAKKAPAKKAPAKAPIKVTTKKPIPKPKILKPEVKDDSPLPSVKKTPVKTQVTIIKPEISPATKIAIQKTPHFPKIKKKRVTKKKKPAKKKTISKTYGVINNVVHDKIGKSKNRSAVMKLYDLEFPLEKYLGRKVTVTFPKSNKQIIGTITRIHGKRSSIDKTVIVRFKQGISPHILTAKGKIQ